MRVSIVHAADLHLDSPLVGLERYEGAPVEQLRGATRRAFENLIQLCLQENAQLLLLAGDLYDGDWRDYATGLFFAKQLARLREVGTQVVWIRGNHDAQSKLTKHLSLGPHCRELGTRKPETVRFEALQVAVHGQGFATPAVTEDLSARYPQPIAGALNIGLLHTALGGGFWGHENYAPCEVRALSARGYHYWALGHVHSGQIVQRPEPGSSDPWVVFPGNLQARHMRERGAKGATLITVEDGAITRVESRVLDVVRFERVSVDASEARSAYDVAELAHHALAHALARADARLLCARLQITGRSPAHGELMRERERAKSEVQSRVGELDGDVWLERVEFATSLPHDLDELAARDDATGQLVRALSASERDPALQRELLGDLSRIQSALPHELNLPSLGIDLEDAAGMRELIASVSRDLLARVLGEP